MYLCLCCLCICVCVLFGVILVVLCLCLCCLVLWLFELLGFVVFVLVFWVVLFLDGLRCLIGLNLLCYLVLGVMFLFVDLIFSLICLYCFLCVRIFVVGLFDLTLV